MNPQQLQLWINVIGAALPIGEALVRTIRAAMSEHGATEEQINAAEAQAVAEARAIQAKREQMGREGDGL